MTKKLKLKIIKEFPLHKVKYMDCYGCGRCLRNAYEIEVNGCYLCLKCFLKEE